MTPVVWFTGPPAAGKTTLAQALAERIDGPVEVLDGDQVRAHFGPLGYSRADRRVQALRVGYVAQLLARHGVTALCALVSPYRSDRDAVRRAAGWFVEVHVHAPLEWRRRRDPKGLYAAGVDVGPYEPPTSAEVVLDTSKLTVEQCLLAVLPHLRSRPL